MDAITRIPQPVNEPVHDYAPDSPERERLVTELDKLANNPLDIHQVIGGEHRTATGPAHEVVQPHNHASAIGGYHKATRADIADAIEASQQAAPTWRELSYEQRQRLPPRRRHVVGPVAGASGRRHDARSVQDRLPGRDRHTL